MASSARYTFKTDTFDYTNEITKKSIFECASLLKTVFTIISLKLLTNKQLEESIYNHLTEDELNCYGINAKFDKRYHDITLIMCLNHTSGLPNNKPLQRLKFKPGTDYNYSGNAFVLLQRILEKKEGKPLTEIYTKMFPKLKNSQYMYLDKFNKNMTLPYDGDKTDKKFIRHIDRPVCSYSMYSNLEDYIKIIKDNTAILSRMKTPQLKINKDISVGIGCLLYKNYIWQHGDNQYYKNFLFYDPDNNIGFINLSNNIKGWKLISKELPKPIIEFLHNIHNYDMKHFE